MMKRSFERNVLLGMNIKQSGTFCLCEYVCVCEFLFMQCLHMSARINIICVFTMCEYVNMRAYVCARVLDLLFTLDDDDCDCLRSWCPSHSVLSF